MIELLLLIAGILIIFKYSGTLNAGAIASEQQAKLFAEEIIKDATIERQYLVQDWDHEISKLKEADPNFEVKSSEDFLKMMKVK